MKVACAIAFTLIVLTASLDAHHSFAAEYDGAKPITLSGTVAKIDWQNPHIYFYLDVKDATGAVMQWKIEGYPPNMLVRQGWKKDVTMKIGDAVKVFGWRARGEVPQAAGRDVTFSDGSKLNCGPPAGTGGQ